MLSELKRLLDKYEGEELSITITGHSLGSALATLCAYDIAQSGLNQPGKDVPIPTEWNQQTAAPANPANAWAPQKPCTIPVTVFSFAGPRVGNDAFRDRLGELGVKVLRVVNVNDKVPRAPGLLFNENMEQISWLEHLVDRLPLSYTHVGKLLRLDNRDSPFLDNARAHAGNVHNMEQYLHLIDGHQGSALPFQLTTGRQVALVNKSCNFVSARFGVPECWWQQENKGLVRQPDGLWVQPDRDLEDVPTADDDFS